MKIRRQIREGWKFGIYLGDGRHPRYHMDVSSLAELLMFLGRPWVEWYNDHSDHEMSMRLAHEVRGMRECFEESDLDPCEWRWLGIAIRCKSGDTSMDVRLEGPSLFAEVCVDTEGKESAALAACKTICDLVTPIVSHVTPSESEG